MPKLRSMWNRPDDRGAMLPVMSLLIVLAMFTTGIVLNARNAAVTSQVTTNDALAEDAALEAMDQAMYYLRTNSFKGGAPDTCISDVNYNGILYRYCIKPTRLAGEPKYSGIDIRVRTKPAATGKGSTTYWKAHVRGMLANEATTRRGIGATKVSPADGTAGAWGFMASEQFNHAGSSSLGGYTAAASTAEDTPDVPIGGTWFRLNEPSPLAYVFRGGLRNADNYPTAGDGQGVYPSGGNDPVPTDARDRACEAPAANNSCWNTTFKGALTELGQNAALEKSQRGTTTAPACNENKNWVASRNSAVLNIWSTGGCYNTLHFDVNTTINSNGANPLIVNSIHIDSGVRVNITDATPDARNVRILATDGVYIQMDGRISAQIVSDGDCFLDRLAHVFGSMTCRNIYAGNTTGLYWQKDLLDANPLDLPNSYWHLLDAGRPKFTPATAAAVGGAF